MNAGPFFSAILIFTFGGLSSIANGRSDQMAQELNAPVPSWLTLGVPIQATPAGSEAADESLFRSRSGGATNSRYRVKIPARGIEKKVDYEIDWTGNNEVGLGCSLSPDGTRLLVNSGTSSHLYEIQPNGEMVEVPLQLPHVTYDAGPKGYLRGWSWADDQTLVATSEITDKSGHETLENRIYVFHMKEKVLSRLDLSALKLASTEGLHVISIGHDLSQLKLSVGGHSLVVKADLKQVPKGMKS